jgi:hypothetical protein
MFFRSVINPSSRNVTRNASCILDSWLTYSLKTNKGIFLWSEIGKQWGHVTDYVSKHSGGLLRVASEQSIVCCNITYPKIIILCDWSATFKSEKHNIMRPVRKVLSTGTYTSFTYQSFIWTDEKWYIDRTSAERDTCCKVPQWNCYYSISLQLHEM